MKSIIELAPKKPVITYPRLMISARDGSVVLFTKRDTGICVHAEGADVLGEYSPDWDTDNFEPFNGTVTLSTD